MFSEYRFFLERRERLRPVGSSSGIFPLRSGEFIPILTNSPNSFGGRVGLIDCCLLKPVIRFPVVVLLTVSQILPSETA